MLELVWVNNHNDETDNYIDDIEAHYLEGGMREQAVCGTEVG